MTEKDEEILADLLLRWEELRERGQDTPASELCREHSHLIEELARRIHALKVTSWLDRPITGEEAPASFPSPTGEPRTLIGRYRLDNLIAEGGFAQVWRGYDLELQRVVAVKVPKPSRLQSADAFMAEARRVARLKHPGIVPVFDVGREGEVCFIVSEFVEGGSLGDHLVNSPPSQPQAIRWIIEIAEALEYAHLHGIIHRDIKPANILIDHHNRALLADFGIAQSANKAGQQALSLGTLRYMSPEQLEGKTVDPRADIFSLGVVLHEALTGKLPYTSAEPNVLRREIVAGVKNVSASDMPAELRRICQKALQHDPQQRHTSAAHFANDLRRYLGTPGSSRWPWILLIVILALAVAAFLWWKSQQPIPVEQGNNTKVEQPPVSNDKPAPAVAKPPALTVPVLMTLGKQDYEQRFFERAIERFTQVIAQEPRNVEAFIMRGRSKVDNGDFSGGIPDFTKAIELEPKNAEIWWYRAQVHGVLRQFDPAIKDAEESLRFQPTNAAKVKDLLARLYSKRAADHATANRFAKAAEDVTQAMKYDPKAAVFYHQRASCYFNMKEYAKAEADWSGAIEREPMKGAHYLHRGYCWQALGKMIEANADFEKAKKLGEK